MSYFSTSSAASTSSALSIKEQNSIISNAKYAVARFAQAYADRQGIKMFFTKQDLEDIAGNTIYKACRSLDSFDPEKGALSTWVSCIAANCVITAFQYKLKRIPISYAMTLENENGDEFSLDETCCSMSRSGYGMQELFSEFEADRDLDRKEFVSRIHEETSKLSEKNQRFERMLEDGYAPKDMAVIEDCTPDAAGKRIWVIRQTLREPVSEIADEFGISFKKYKC